MCNDIFLGDYTTDINGSGYLVCGTTNGKGELAVTWKHIFSRIWKMKCHVKIKGEEKRIVRKFRVRRR